MEMRGLECSRIFFIELILFHIYHSFERLFWLKKTYFLNFIGYSLKEA